MIKDFIRCPSCGDTLYLAPKEYHTGDYIRCSKCKRNMCVQRITANSWDLSWNVSSK